jgi:hypothetical protein
LGLLPTLGLLRPASEHPLRYSALMITAHLLWGGYLGLRVPYLQSATAGRGKAISGLGDH